MKNCDCNERIGIEINSWERFEKLKKFFDEQVKNGIFTDLTDYENVWYLDGGRMVDSYSTTVKKYKCNICGCLWEFTYPEFPAKGLVRKFPNGEYSERSQYK